MKNWFSPASLFRILQSCLTLGFAAGLATLSLNGWMARFLADDYCYGWVFAQHGFWGAQIWSYLHVTMFASDRYSLTLFFGLTNLAGPVAVQVLPGLSILLWLAGLVFAARQLVRAFRLPFSFLDILLVSAALVFLALYQAPNQYQILYWRPGMLPYLAPLITGTWAAGIIFRQIQKERVSPFSWLGLALLVLVTGGFSETAAAIQTGFFLLLGAAAWLTRRSGGALSRRLLSLSGAALFASLAAMAILLLSPTNAARQAPLPTPPDFLTLVRLSVQFALDSIRDSLKGTPLPHLVNLFLAALVSFNAYSRKPDPASIPWRWLAVIPLVVVLLVTCGVAPSVYAEFAYPELRALMDMQWIVILGITGLGWLAGQGLCRFARAVQIRPAYAGLATALVGMLLLGYSVRAARTIYLRAPWLMKRAAAWDQRDQTIRQALQQGITHMEVPALDAISGIYELQPDPGFWVN